MVYKKKTVFNRITKRFKDLSKFDHGPEPNFRGTEVFKTVHGAILSLVLVFLVVNRALMAGDRFFL